MGNKLSRREFLERVGAGAVAGTAVVSVPAILGGCASRKVVTRVAPAPVKSSFDAFGVSSEVISRVLQQGLSAGGEFSELFLQHKVTHWLGMEDGQINRAYSTVDVGAGIRVLKGDATGFAFSEDLEVDALLGAATTAAAVANSAPQAQVSPLVAAAVADHYPVVVPWTEVGVDRKLPLVEQTEQLIRGRDPRIVKVTVYLSDETSRILVANSEGLHVEDHQPMALLSATCVARHKGKTETGWQSASGRDGLGFFTQEVITRTAQQAADYTTMLFDAAPPPVGELPVVLAPGVTGILLHEAMGHGFEADFNRKGVSIYAEKLGQRIAPEAINIVDDGTNERLRGSINIDDEGTPGQRTPLVENGVLRSFLHDRISGKHYGVASTGSGRRQSFRFPPVPRMRNTYMLNGPHKAEEIIASVDRGLYAEVFSNGQVNIGAGDFTFFLKHGRLIEKGKLTRVVKDANLIGAGPKVLETIDMVADDMTMYSGGGYCGKDGQRIPVGFGLPTVRAGAMSIGGRKS